MVCLRQIISLSREIISFVPPLLLGDLFFEFGGSQGFGIFREIKTKCAAFAETTAAECGLAFEYVTLAA